MRRPLSLPRPWPRPTVRALREAVTLEAIRAHQAALADIATANGGTRDAKTPGYQASVDYVEEKLREAGYQVTVQPFHFLTFEETSPPQMARTAPEPRSYVHGTDFLTVRYSGSGIGRGRGGADDRCRDPADARAELHQRMRAGGFSGRRRPRRRSRWCSAAPAPTSRRSTTPPRPATRRC